MSMHVVIVEDDTSIGSAMHSALTDEGYRTDWFTTGGDATTTLESDPPDIVLLDIGLSDVDRMTLCRWLREVHPDLPIILVTARDTDIDIIVGPDAGATEYVAKPFSMRVLLARVRAHLRSVEAQGREQPLTVGRLVVDPASYRHRSTVPRWISGPASSSFSWSCAGRPVGS